MFSSIRYSIALSPQVSQNDIDVGSVSSTVTAFAESPIGDISDQDSTNQALDQTFCINVGEEDCTSVCRRRLDIFVVVLRFDLITDGCNLGTQPVIKHCNLLKT